MFLKITTIALMAFIARSTEGTAWNGFVASWDRNTSSHFYNLPKTMKAAKFEGWSYISGVDPPKGLTPMCYNGDPTFIILYKKGRATGFQLAFLVSEFGNSQLPLKYDELDVVITKRFNGKLYFTATTYFYNDESTGIRRIWFKEKNRCREIPTNASLVPSETRFLMKKCVPTMGTHYYTWKSTSDCATLYPWFLVADKGTVTGVGFQGMGIPTTLGIRKWWENVPDAGIHAVMSDPPPCAVSGTAKFGTLSMHIWFADRPQDITCS